MVTKVKSTKTGEGPPPATRKKNATLSSPQKVPQPPPPPSAGPPAAPPTPHHSNSLSSSQSMNTSANDRVLASSLPRNSISPGLPSIRRVGSLTGSINGSPLANQQYSRPVSSATGGANVSSGNVSLPPLMSPVSVSQAANRSSFSPAAPNGAARRVSTKKGGRGPKNIVAPPPPQPTERDVARISRWWTCIRMRHLVKIGAPSRCAAEHMEREALARAERIAKARVVLDKFLLRCASKLRQYVDQKRLIMLCKVATVISTFVRSKLSEVKADCIRRLRVQRVCERLLKYWKRSEQYKKREYVSGNHMILSQCCAEEALERREVERREKLELLDLRRLQANCPAGKWHLKWRASKELVDAARMDTDDVYITSSPMSPPMSKVAEWSTNRRGRRQSLRGDAGLIVLPRTPSPTADSSIKRRQSLRKNSLMLQRLSRTGSINLDGLMGGSKSGGLGAPVSGAALRLRGGFDGASSPTGGSSQPTTAGLAFFGNNVDHLESVTASPMLVEFSKRESTSTTRDRALADARLQLLNQQFLYPLRMSSGVVSFSSGASTAIKQKMCVSEMFLGDGWATWFVATSFITQAAPKKQGSTVHRRSVVVRKRCGGELLDAQRRLSAANGSAAGSTRTRSIVGISNTSFVSSFSDSTFSRFAARRSSLAQSRLGGGGGVSQSMAYVADPADDSANHVEGAIHTKKGLVLRPDSGLFSIDREAERLLIQEHSQRMRVTAQSLRMFQDILQRIEEERQGDLADLMSPTHDRVIDRSVPQKEVFLFGIM